MIRRNAYVACRYALQIALLLSPMNWVRINLLRIAGAKIQNGVYLSRQVKIDFPWRLHISKNSYVNGGVYLDCRGGRIFIGENCDISTDALIYTVTHNIQSEKFEEICGDVMIEAKCWVGARAIVLPGSKVAAGSVIGANSVFSGTSPQNSLIVGVPGRLVKILNPDRAINVRAK